MHLHNRAGTLADMLNRQAPADYRQRGLVAIVAD